MSEFVNPEDRALLADCFFRCLSSPLTGSIREGWGKEFVRCCKKALDVFPFIIYVGFEPYVQTDLKNGFENPTSWRRWDAHEATVNLTCEDFNRLFDDMRGGKEGVVVNGTRFTMGTFQEHFLG